MWNSIVQIAWQLMICELTRHHNLKSGRILSIPYNSPGEERLMKGNSSGDQKRSSFRDCVKQMKTICKSWRSLLELYPPTANDPTCVCSVHYCTMYMGLAREHPENSSVCLPVQTAFVLYIMTIINPLVMLTITSIVDSSNCTILIACPNLIFCMPYHRD